MFPGLEGSASTGQSSAGSCSTEMWSCVAAGIRPGAGGSFFFFLFLEEREHFVCWSTECPGFVTSGLLPTAKGPECSWTAHHLLVPGRKGLNLNNAGMHCSNPLNVLSWWGFNSISFCRMDRKESVHWVGSISKQVIWGWLFVCYAWMWKPCFLLQVG